MPRLFSVSPSFVTVFAQIYVGGLFLYSGIQKLLHPYVFMRILVQYDLFTFRWVFGMTLGIIVLETGLGLLFLMGVYLRQTALLLSGVLVVFSAIVLNALIQGKHIPCGCIRQTIMISQYHLLQNGVLFGFCLWVVWMPYTWWKVV